MKNVFRLLLLPLLAMALLNVGCHGPIPNPKEGDTAPGIGPSGEETGFIPNYSSQDAGMDDSGLVSRQGGNGSDYNTSTVYDPSGVDGSGSGMAGGMGGQDNALASVYFGFDQSNIRSQERSKVQNAATYLQQNPSSEVLIEGHCDWKGTTEYNMALGERRAKSVRDYLSQLGVSATRVEIKSMGDLEAIEGAPASQRADDRRADILLR